MLEIQETCETYQGEPVQKSMLQLIKQKKVGDLKNPVTVDIGYRMWSLPSYALVLLWSTNLPLCSFPSFWNFNVYSLPLHIGSM